MDYIKIEMMVFNKLYCFETKKKTLIGRVTELREKVTEFVSSSIRESKERYYEAHPVINAPVLTLRQKIDSLEEKLMRLENEGRN